MNHNPRTNDTSYVVDSTPATTEPRTYPDMARVKLSEVVRSTKRIVAGAATFPASIHTVLLTGLLCC